MPRKTSIGMLCAFLLALSTTAATGALLDRQFGDEGVVLTNIAAEPGQGGLIHEFTVDPQGRIVLLTDNRVIRLNESGELDRTFSNDGFAPLLIPYARNIAIQPDGKVVLAGSLSKDYGVSDLVLRRYLPDGTQDLSFGREGTVTDSRSQKDAAIDLFAQADGDLVVFDALSCWDEYMENPCSYGFGTSIFVFGENGNYVSDEQVEALGFRPIEEQADGTYIALSGSEVWRFSASGEVIERTDFEWSDPTQSPDSHYPTAAFQSDGSLIYLKRYEQRVERLRSSDYAPDPTFEHSDLPCQPTPGTGYFGVAVDAEDRILIGGDCGLVRLEADGSIDESFGAGGIVGGRTGYLMGVDQADRILRVTGDYEAGANEVQRYLDNGNPDSTFGGDGVVTVFTLYATHDEARAGVRLPSGRVLIAGSSVCPQSECGGFALARYRATGALDRNFGHEGRVVTRRDHLSGAHALLLLPSRSLLAGGESESSRGEEPGTYESAQFALAKYRPGGRLDSLFGDQGIVKTHASTHPRGRSELYGLARQDNGRIVAAGLAVGCGSLCFTVVRYLSDGRIDPSFGGEGKFGAPGMVRLGLEVGANAVAILGDGRILVTGGGYGHFVTIRLLPDGRLDRTFGRGGIVKTTVRVNWERPDRSITDLSREPKAIVLGRGGRFTIAGGGTRGRGLVIRYLGNGSLDRSYGQGGRIRIWPMTIEDLLRTRCGLVAVGTTNLGDGTRGVGVLGLPGNTPGALGKGRIRLPFGARPGAGSDLVRGDGRTGLAVGTVRTGGSRSGDFALAQLNVPAVAGRCGNR